MKEKNPTYFLLPCMLVCLLFLAFACGRDWSVRGSSFPTQEKPPDRTISQPEKPQGGQVIVPSRPAPKAVGEADEISRRAEELRREAERLAQEAALLGEEPGDLNQGQASSPKGAGKEYPAQFDEAGGPSRNFQSIPELSDVFFAYDEALLSEEAQRVLEKNAEWLRSQPKIEILIEGHCDERGTVEYNLALGERRAQSTKDYLVSLGVSQDCLYTISYGKERPFALGHTEEAWAQNRRAHFVLRSP